MGDWREAQREVGRNVDIGGGRHYAVHAYGASGGLPVLALHGAPASHLMFAPADAPAATLGLSILAPDREGYGATPLDGAPTLAARAEALHRLVDALALDRLAIWAISGGAPYALALAARLGARVRALALVSPMGPVADLARDVPIALPQRRFFLHLARRRRLLRLAAGAAAAAFQRAPEATGRWFARLAGGDDRRLLSTPEAASLLIAMTRDALRQGVEAGVRDLEIFGRPWDVDLGAISAPTLLWQGTADRIVPKAVALALAERVPACTLYKLRGAGHFWVLEHVDEVLRAIADRAAR